MTSAAEFKKHISRTLGDKMRLVSGDQVFTFFKIRKTLFSRSAFKPAGMVDNAAPSTVFSQRRLLRSEIMNLTFLSSNIPNVSLESDWLNRQKG
jgi:hypothetical protein